MRQHRNSAIPLLSGGLSRGIFVLQLIDSRNDPISRKTQTKILEKPDPRNQYPKNQFRNQSIRQTNIQFPFVVQNPEKRLKFVPIDGQTSLLRLVLNVLKSPEGNSSGFFVCGVPEMSSYAQDDISGVR